MRAPVREEIEPFDEAAAAAAREAEQAQAVEARRRRLEQQACSSPKVLCFHPQKGPAVVLSGSGSGSAPPPEQQRTAAGASVAAPGAGTPPRPPATYSAAAGWHGTAACQPLNQAARLRFLGVQPQRYTIPPITAYDRACIAGTYRPGSSISGGSGGSSGRRSSSRRRGSVTVDGWTAPHSLLECRAADQATPTGECFRGVRTLHTSVNAEVLSHQASHVQCTSCVPVCRRPAGHLFALQRAGRCGLVVDVSFYRTVGAVHARQRSCHSAAFAPCRKMHAIKNADLLSLVPLQLPPSYCCR